MNSEKSNRLVQGALTLSVFLAGCTVGPEYVPPETLVSETWSEPELEGDASERQRLADWWTLFDDPTLNDLIGQTISSTPDKDRALARIREARARFAVAKAATRPTVTGGLNAGAVESADFTGDVDWRGVYDGRLDASWEVDLFGSVRRSVQSAGATLEAREAEYVDVMTSLVAEVAITYVEMRTLEERLRITRESVVSQEKSYNLTLWRSEAGFTTTLDLERARSNLESTRAQIPLLQRDLSQSRNALAFLSGNLPGALDELLVTPRQIPVPPNSIALGVPADVLRQRGDIRTAERNLAVQSARIGIANASLYPSLRLTGAVGASASDVSGLFDEVSRVTSLGPNLTAPIFDAGRLRANVDVENALFEQALATYEQTVLNALREAEDAIVARSAARRRIASLGEALSAAVRANELALLEYEAGLTDFERVLDTERTLLSAQEQVTLNQASETQAVISLYKAVGGGWAASDY